MTVVNADLQEAHEVVYELRQDQQQSHSHLTADLACRAQVSYELVMLASRLLWCFV